MISSRDAHNNIVIVLVVLASTNIFIAIYVTCNTLYCNIFGHQYIDCNICDHQYIVLQYVQPINILIAIPATTNILYCNICSQQYIDCNIWDYQYIVLQYLESTIYLLQYLRPSIYCIAIPPVNNLSIALLLYTLYIDK
jgi:hypothetical protein